MQSAAAGIRHGRVEYNKVDDFLHRGVVAEADIQSIQLLLLLLADGVPLAAAGGAQVAEFPFCLLVGDYGEARVAILGKLLLNDSDPKA